MKIEIKAIIIMVAIIMMAGVSAIIYFQNKEISGLKADLSIERSNVITLNAEVDHFKTENDKNAARVSALIYSMDQIEQFDPKLVATVNDLGLKLKNVQSIVEAQTETIKKFKVQKVFLDKDTCYNYEDTWTSFSMCTSNDSAKISVRDSITTVLSNIPKHKFLWWEWGSKGVNVSITSKNPDANYSYLKLVQLAK